MQILTESATNETAQEAAQEAVETTFDLLQLILSIGLGVLIGMISGILIVAIGRFMGRRHPALKPFFDACARPITTLCVVLGATIGFWVLEGVKDATNPRWFAIVDHIFLILLIAAGTWLVVGIINGAVELIHNRMLESSQRRAARVRTQTQILHRVVVVVIWVLGFGGILLTFPTARTAGASLLASAGLVSVVAGLAAQTTLGNVFAGLQLAFSDSLRVGDIVQYKENYTTVEEITLTYVVLAVWDGRRIIVPSSLMTTQDFENWTRRKPDMIGEVTWEVDWSLPIEAARKEFRHILSQTNLWDGKTGVLSIKEANSRGLLLRAVVSAEDSATLTDLKNFLREKMVLWIQQDAPQAIPQQHYSQYAPTNIAAAQAKTLEKLRARLAEEEPALIRPRELTAPAVAEDENATTVFTVGDLRKLGVVTATAELPQVPAAAPENDTAAPASTGMGASADEEASEAGAPHATQAASAPATQNATQSENRAVRGKSDSAADESRGNSAFFTGSPEAEARKKEFSGPGAEVYAERNRKIAQTNAAGQLPAIPAADTAAEENTGSANTDATNTDAAANTGAAAESAKNTAATAKSTETAAAEKNNAKKTNNELKQNENLEEK